MRALPDGFGRWWLSGGRIKLADDQMILDAGYTDTYRLRHFQEIGHTFPTWAPHLRLDYAFCRPRFRNV